MGGGGGVLGLIVGWPCSPLSRLISLRRRWILCLGCPQVSHDVFQQVEQPPDEFACLFICDAVQVKVFKHSAAGSSGETLTCIARHYASCPPSWQPARAWAFSPGFLR